MSDISNLTNRNFYFEQQIGAKANDNKSSKGSLGNNVESSIKSSISASSSKFGDRNDKKSDKKRKKKNDNQIFHAANDSHDTENTEELSTPFQRLNII
jgi:hypothetical protein